MNSLKLQLKSDFIGALASFICLIHCIATPFIFVSAASIEHHHHEHHHGDSPLWWSAIDIVFIVISFLAVYWSAKSSSKTWMKFALYLCWAGLAFFILNEKFEGPHLPHFLIYVPAFGLIVLHLYNKRYCQCINGNCPV